MVVVTMYINGLASKIFSWIPGQLPHPLQMTELWTSSGQACIPATDETSQWALIINVCQSCRGLNYNQNQLHFRSEVSGENIRGSCDFPPYFLYITLNLHLPLCLTYLLNMFLNSSSYEKTWYASSDWFKWGSWLQKRSSEKSKINS